MKTTLRAAIVGAGGIARIHADVIANRVDNAELVAVCDISPAALVQFSEIYDVPGLYTDLAAMLDGAEMDFVIVCNWGVDHAQTVIEISESRKVQAILCEKPFAVNATEAEAMVKAARTNGVMLAEAYKFRHHPMHLAAKAMVDEGAIGDVTCIRSTLISGRRSSAPDPRTPDNDWRFSRAKGGGSVNDLGCYCLAHARFIYGMEPTRVFAHPQMGAEVDAAAAVQVIFPGNRYAQFAVGFNAMTTQSAEIIGTDGILRIDKPWNNSDTATTLVYDTVGETKSISFEPLLQYTCQLEHLCECLLAGQTYRIPIQESIDQMRAVDAVNESMATGKVVDL